MHNVLRNARECAVRYESFSTQPEHLLMALTDDHDMHQFLADMGIRRREFRRALAREINHLPKGTNEAQARRTSNAFRNIVDAAREHAEICGRDAIWSDMLEAFFAYDESDYTKFLRGYGIDPESIRDYMIPAEPDDDDEEADDSMDDEHAHTDYMDENMPDIIVGGEAIQEFCVNLNMKAAKGLIDPLIGRARELDETVETLCQRRKCNPLYVGDPGVGKTALAEGLAARIVDGSVPDKLFGTPVYALDMGALVAGTNLRGDFEGRLKKIIKELAEIKERYGVTPIIFIDEIHTLIGAGAASGGTLDASNILKPALADGSIRCMGATTYKEYRQNFETDKALVRRFQLIDVPEPSVAETVEILQGLRDKYEAHHGVLFTEDAIEAAARLAKRHIIQQKLPDSAVTVLDKAGAYLSSRNKSGEVDAQVIADTVAKIARKPPDQVSGDDAEALRTLEAKLKSAVFDQETAIREVATAVKLARAGLRDADKTVGNYLFSGPTGVGKTEVAKQLAASLGIDFLRFDMSEYMERHAVSRLIGAPPGYVGFDQGGLLTGQVDQHPYSVVLLDEIEKAHPDIYNILLQVMDNGRLTDNNGKTIDFRNVILIMTTNAGAADMQKESMGFMKTKSTADTDAVNQLFTPEFRNRLDAVIPFERLGRDAARRVAEKFIATLQAQLAERRVTMTLDNAAYGYLVDKGYDELMGARPMARVIQKTVKEPLADELLYGALKKGGTVDVTYDANHSENGKPPGLRFAFNRAAEAEAAASTPAPASNPAPKKGRQPGREAEPAPF